MMDPTTVPVCRPQSRPTGAEGSWRLLPHTASQDAIMACIPRMFICQFLMNHYFNNQSAGCINSSLIRHLHLVAHSVVRHREGVLMPTLLQKFQLEGFLEQGVLLQGLELPFQLWTLLFHQLHLSPQPRCFPHQFFLLLKQLVVGPFKNVQVPALLVLRPCGTEPVGQDSLGALGVDTGVQSRIHGSRAAAATLAALWRLRHSGARFKLYRTPTHQGRHGGWSRQWLGAKGFGCHLTERVERGRRWQYVE
mmetsp:Transcript_17447/g.44659  ORF Transcript_17447/g.44659 Transcript_17447/m.44659 type:complete len:250 (+) Transcript_17447:184-933(+)